MMSVMVGMMMMVAMSIITVVVFMVMVVAMMVVMVMGMVVATSIPILRMNKLRLMFLNVITATSFRMFVLVIGLMVGSHGLFCNGGYGLGDGGGRGLGTRVVTMSITNAVMDMVMVVSIVMGSVRSKINVPSVYILCDGDRDGDGDGAHHQQSQYHRPLGLEMGTASGCCLLHHSDGTVFVLFGESRVECELLFSLCWGSGSVGSTAVATWTVRVRSFVVHESFVGVLCCSRGWTSVGQSLGVARGTIRVQDRICLQMQVLLCL